MVISISHAYVKINQVLLSQLTSHKACEHGDRRILQQTEHFATYTKPMTESANFCNPQKQMFVAFLEIYNEESICPIMIFLLVFLSCLCKANIGKMCEKTA